MPTDPVSGVRVRANEELRQVALEEFASVGFQAASLQRIADHAGYSKSSVLYHFASKEALLEAAIEPAIARFEAVIDDYLTASAGTERRQVLLEQTVEMLVAHRLAVHIFLIQGPALHDVPIIARADAAVRRLAASISDEPESLLDQTRFGIALGGAAFILTAGRTFLDSDRLPDTDEQRAALLVVLAELFAPRD